MITLGSLSSRLLIALACGALIGFEREYRGQSAGMKTLGLVSLGSALITIVSAYGFESVVLATPKATFDPSRVAAQIVSGIGFLGAGAILLRRDVVRGLTTAASVWLVASIGLAAGAGLLVEAVLTTVIALLALLLLRPIEQRWFPKQSAHRIRLRIEPPSAESEVLAQIPILLSRSRIGLRSLETRPTRHGQIIELKCRILHQEDLVTAVRELRALPEVKAVRAELLYSARGRFDGGDVSGAGDSR